MAYSAEIDVKVRNLGSISKLEEKLSSINRSVNAINRRRTAGASTSRSGRVDTTRAIREQLTGEKQITDEIIRRKNAFASLNKVKDGNDPVSKSIRRNQERQQKLRRANLSDNVDSRFLTGQKSEARVNIQNELNKRKREEKALQAKLGEMEEKSNHLAKQRLKDRRRTRSLGNDIVKQTTREVENRLKARRLESKSIAPKGDFSRISDRQSRNREGERTFMNNPFGRIGIRPTRGFDTQSALISGAFPLLFGQGPIGALAGGLGGGIGGMFGTMGGFAGGIAATAIVQQIQGVIAGISKLGNALSPFSADVNAVIASLGVGGTALGKQLDTYAQVASKTDALNEATRQMAILIGDDGVAAIKEFGESSNALKNDFDRAMLGMQASVAKFALFIGNRFRIFDKDGERALADRTRKTARSGTDKEMNEISNKIDEIIRAPFDAEKGVTVDGQNFENKSKAIDFLRNQQKERQKIIDLEKAGLLVQKTVSQISKNRLADLVEEGRVLKDTLEGGEVKAQVEARMRALTKEVLGDQKELTAEQVVQIENQRSIITNQINSNNELKEAVDLAKQVEDAFKQISVSIGDDIKNGIAGLIKGTSTLSDLLNNVADRFLDVALNQGLFGDILGAGGKKGGGILGFLTGGKLAEGGRAAGGKSFLVGEKGPELFVPRSTGTVIPNNKLGGGSTNNVVVNVDASGSDVQGDEATAKELGTLISVAVQGELLKQQRPGGLLSR